METQQSAGDSAAQETAIEIRLLGDLRITRAGQAVVLPASKRSRALLGYLVATGTAQTRQSLCDLLWDGPDDPRAELRWSLTKLRPVIDDPAARRIEADRERVVFVSHGAGIDTVSARLLLAGGVEHTGIAALEQAAALLGGEFLAGLELPACYSFHQWCMAEREWYGALHRKVLAALSERLSDQPQRALVHARAMVAADPLSEAGHAALISLLSASGRVRDAEAHCRQAEALFQRELGAMPGKELRDAARQLRAAPQHAQRAMAEATRPEPMPMEPAAHEPDHDAPSPLVGRSGERGTIEAAVATLAQAGSGRLLLFVGEPGMGKTRLLQTLSECASGAGCRVFYARCFEAEMMRPYGSWIDALRSLPPELVAEPLRRDLSPLLPVPDCAPVEPDGRARLFAAASELVKDLAAAQPLVLILDDLQWLDEGSAALLHYLTRSAGPATRLLIAGAARQGEVDDNPWARGVLHSLAREHHLQRCALDPLDAADVAALLARSAPALDATAVHRQSGGNPLFVLALADAAAAGDVAAGLSLQALTAEQIQRLDENSRELIIWSAAMGREFRPETLSLAMGVAEAELMPRFDRFERRGLLKETGAGHYDFAHDLVREAVYRGLSQPRRRALHRQIAHALKAAAASDPGLHGELMYHASQAGDTALAVRACIATAEHCLRVFANQQAVAAAVRGLAMLEQLPAGAERVSAHIELLRLRIVAASGTGATRIPELREQLQEAIKTAELMGLYALAASGLHMQSWLAQQANDLEATREATLRAERMTRTADAATRCQQLANTGRCLLEVESDMTQARALIAAAAAQAQGMDLQLIELEWGRGLIARWDGDLDTAQAALRTSVGLARVREDRWREFECLVWLAIIELERGRLDAVDQLCQEVAEVGARMGDMNVPMSAALRALASERRAPDNAAGDARAALDASLAEFRRLDDKVHLAYVLNQAAALDLDHNRLAQAEAAAREALGAAQLVGRNTEVLVALALLACIACAEGKPEEAQDRLAARGADAAVPSARARFFLERAELALREDGTANTNARRIPTPVPTKGA